MSSLDRMLRLLDLFAAEQPRWTVEQAIARTGYSRSTIYRYFKSLSAAGLVASGGDGAYGLGPAVIGLDRLCRLNDPLLTRAQPHLAELARALGLVAVVESFRDQVVVTHVEVGPEASVPADLQRGLSAGLLDSAAARVLLAHENARRLRRFHDVAGAAIGKAGLGANWTAFRQALRVQRRVGFAVHDGAGALGALRVAVPVFAAGDRAIAALAAPATVRDEARVGEHLLRGARRISALMADQAPPAQATMASEATWRPSASRANGAVAMTEDRLSVA
ncbi:MAG: helix-turn-helix domain-containing protein [Zavarzinia sp.]|nr:helix-turn-helix domain-containing protein [Zavarzinia sp.]